MQVQSQQQQRGTVTLHVQHSLVRWTLTLCDSTTTCVTTTAFSNENIQHTITGGTVTLQQHDALAHTLTPLPYTSPYFLPHLRIVHATHRMLYHLSHSEEACVGVWR